MVQKVMFLEMVVLFLFLFVLNLRNWSPVISQGKKMNSSVILLLNQQLKVQSYSSRQEI